MDFLTPLPRLQILSDLRQHDARSTSIAAGQPRILAVDCKVPEKNKFQTFPAVNRSASAQDFAQLRWQTVHTRPFRI